MQDKVECFWSNMRQRFDWYSCIFFLIVVLLASIILYVIFQFYAFCHTLLRPFTGFSERTRSNAFYNNPPIQPQIHSSSNQPMVIHIPWIAKIKCYHCGNTKDVQDVSDFDLDNNYLMLPQALTAGQ